MTTITKERIELFIKNPLENGLTRGEQMELARIALASLEAEPVAWKATFTQIDHEYNTFTAMYSDKAEVERWVRLHKVGDFRAKITPLYASSPALVVPDKLPREYIRGWPLAYSDYAEGWNDCREAMLQSGNFRENKDSSTNNFREISETSTNSPLIPGEVLSAIREVARIRADFDDFDGDRRGVGDCLDEAEQELIVTINKYASQLAVEPVVPDDVLEQTVASPVPGNQVSELTMWVKRLAHSLKYANSLSSLPDKAMEYLNQNGLISVEDVLR
ncbi:Eaa protein [Escherichia coli]|nr:Eaa protein [Escherichia coli]